MKPLPKPQRREPPRQAWKKKYECHKSKDKHEFVLDTPHDGFWARVLNIPVGVSVEEYYIKAEEYWREQMAKYVRD